MKNLQNCENKKQVLGWLKEHFQINGNEIATTKMLVNFIKEWFFLEIGKVGRERTIASRPNLVSGWRKKKKESSFSMIPDASSISRSRPSQDFENTLVVVNDRKT